jgi:hypothetical protein
MTDWREELLAGDPIAAEPELSSADVDAIRRVVLTAAPVRRPWPAGFVVALACSLSILAAGSVWIVRQTPQPRGEPPTTGSSAAMDYQPSDQPERRQVQFATPGGTRVIWVLESISN